MQFRLLLRQTVLLERAWALLNDNVKQTNAYLVLSVFKAALPGTGRASLNKSHRL